MSIIFLTASSLHDIFKLAKIGKTGTFHNTLRNMCFNSFANIRLSDHINNLGIQSKSSKAMGEGMGTHSNQTNSMYFSLIFHFIGV